MKTIATSLLMLLVCSISFAQEFEIAPVVGIAATKPMMSSAARDMYDDHYFEDLDARIKHKFPLTPGFQVGALAEFVPDESFGIQSGFIYHVRGYRDNANWRSEVGSEIIELEIKRKGSFNYLEIPFWLTYRFGESGIKITAGPTFGFAMGGRTRATAYYDGETESSSESVKVGNDPEKHVLKPLDLSFQLGIGKEIELTDNSAIEITLFAQPSVTKWNVIDREYSDIALRHFTAGIRAAYVFSFNK